METTISYTVIYIGAEGGLGEANTGNILDGHRGEY